MVRSATIRRDAIIYTHVKTVGEITLGLSVHMDLTMQHQESQGLKPNASSLDPTPLGHSPIEVPVLASLLRGHPDKQKVTFLINGFTEGFRLGVKTGPSYICETL